MKVAAMTAMLCLLATPVMAQPIVKTVPPEGALKERQRVFIDDGTCPAGQIKLMTGGSFVRRIPRTESCVPRKR